MTDTDKLIEEAKRDEKVLAADGLDNHLSDDSRYALMWRQALRVPKLVAALEAEVARAEKAAIAHGNEAEEHVRTMDKLERAESRLHAEVAARQKAEAERDEALRVQANEHHYRGVNLDRAVAAEGREATLRGELALATIQKEWDDERLHRLSPAVGLARMYLQEGDSAKALTTLDEACELLKGVTEKYLARYAAARAALGESRQEAGGADLIAAERRRQIEVEGWDAEHDRDHNDGELAKAAACYVLPEIVEEWWPWSNEWWKPGTDETRRLVKAGALIAAELDRRAALAVSRQGGNRW